MSLIGKQYKILNNDKSDHTTFLFSRWMSLDRSLTVLSSKLSLIYEIYIYLELRDVALQTNDEKLIKTMLYKV